MHNKLIIWSNAMQVIFTAMDIWDFVKFKRENKIYIFM